MGILRQNTSVVVLLIAAVGMMLAATGSAQTTPSCASKLIPCKDYLNTTSPPESCCNPLKEAVTNELDCLCALFNNPTIFKAFNINLTQALELPTHCGLTSTTSACNKSGAQSPSSTTPPATPGGNGSNAAVGGGMNWTGLSGLMSLLLFSWSILA